MSDSALARRTDIDVVFGGVNITDSLKPYLLSLTYTDNEEDETDDLQIKLHDRDGIWRTKWLNQAIQAAAETPSVSSSTTEEATTQYKVIAKSGLSVHSRAGSDYYVYGALAYGTIITVASISGGWANFTYSGKNAYVNATYLQAVYTGGQTVSVQSSGVSWDIGDEVIASGRPQYSSYGNGTPGAMVNNYRGTITHLNLKSGIPYPICVGSLGWFSESQVQKVGATKSGASEEKVASKGLKIQATIVRKNWNGDGKDSTLATGQYELDNVSASGPPATITIKGTSLPYSSTIRQTQKSKSWETYNLSGIANEIASKNGMSCQYLCRQNPFYQRVEQYRASDITFLQKLCQDAGASLKVTNNSIVIFDQAEYESKSPIRVIQYGKAGGYLKYKLSTGENDTYTSCRVSYTAPNGSVITGMAYADGYDKDSENNQCLEVRQKVSNVAEANALASKMLRLHNKYEFTASFTFPGDTKLLAGCTVDLKGWGAWDGRYIIKSAKHTVGGSGYTTQISLRKALKAISTANSSAIAMDETPMFEVGDVVKLTSDATVYGETRRYYEWVYAMPLYIRQISGDRAVVSTVKTGPITGPVATKHLQKV